MDSFLISVYNGIRKGFKFEAIINVALVKKKIKPGCIVDIDKKTICVCQHEGLYVYKYNQPNLGHLSLVTYEHIDQPEFTDKNFHKKIGNILGYISPINIDKNFDGSRRSGSELQITFTRNNKKYTQSILNQIIFNKSQKQIAEYYDKYIKCIKEMNIPNIIIYDIQLISF
jgi:hypothetical protein